MLDAGGCGRFNHKPGLTFAAHQWLTIFCLGCQCHLALSYKNTKTAVPGTKRGLGSTPPDASNDPPIETKRRRAMREEPESAENERESYCCVPPPPPAHMQVVDAPHESIRQQKDALERARKLLSECPAAIEVMTESWLPGSANKLEEPKSIYLPWTMPGAQSECAMFCCCDAPWSIMQV